MYVCCTFPPDVWMIVVQRFLHASCLRSLSFQKGFTDEAFCRAKHWNGNCVIKTRHLNYCSHSKLNGLRRGDSMQLIMMLKLCRTVKGKRKTCDDSIYWLCLAHPRCRFQPKALGVHRFPCTLPSEIIESQEFSVHVHYVQTSKIKSKYANQRIHLILHQNWGAVESLELISLGFSVSQKLLDVWDLDAS